MKRMLFLYCAIVCFTPMTFCMEKSGNNNADKVNNTNDLRQRLEECRERMKRTGETIKEAEKMIEQFIHSFDQSNKPTMVSTDSNEVNEQLMSQINLQDDNQPEGDLVPVQNTKPTAVLHFLMTKEYEKTLKEYNENKN